MKTKPTSDSSRKPTIPMSGIGRPAVHFIVGQTWFVTLSPELQYRLLENVYTVQCERGDTVLRAGDEVQGWYAVLSGLVKLQSQTPQGRRQGYLGFPSGQWFGEGSVLRREPRGYDVVALRDSQLLCLPRELFREMYETSIAFSHTICQQLNTRLSQAMAVIEAMRLRSPEQRVAMYLSPLLWMGSRRVDLAQEELGILSGLSRQTVNAVLNEFARKKLVSLDFGRIEIISYPGLMSLAGLTGNDKGECRPVRFR